MLQFSVYGVKLSAVQSTMYVEEFLPGPFSFLRLGPPSPTYRSPSLFLPHAEIPRLLLCSYLYILLQMEVVSVCTEALCSSTFP